MKNSALYVKGFSNNVLIESCSILFVGDKLNDGGAGKILKFVANSCSSMFEKVFLYSMKQDDYPIAINPDIVFLDNKIKTTDSSLWRIKIICDIRKIVISLSPNIVCSFTSEVSVITRIATFGLNTIVVSSERGDPFTLPLIWKLLTKLTYSTSNACFFQLNKARDYFGKKVCKKSFVIPNPFILTEDVVPFDGERKKTIVSAGRFVPEKQFDILIDAFAMVHKSHKDYSLIIFGDGPLLNNYKRQAEKLGIKNFVSFPGYSNNVAKSVREEGIFILSSRYEGIPNVLIEAMSVGIPTISSNCEPGGPDFLTNHGARGLLVPIDDVKAMADAIEKLLEDKELYHYLEIEGPKIRQIFNKEIIVKKWLDSFQSILNKAYAQTCSN